MDQVTIPSLELYVVHDSAATVFSFLSVILPLFLSHAHYTQTKQTGIRLAQNCSKWTLYLKDC